MYLAHGAGFDGDEGGGEGGCDGEGGGIEDLDGAAGDAGGFLLAPMIRIGPFLWYHASGPRYILLRNVLRRGCTREDPELFLRHVLHCFYARPEVLGYDRLRVSQHEFREEECVFFAEGTVVEDEQEFAAAFEGLDRVWDAGWEEPDVAFLDVVDEGLAGFIHGGDAHAAVQPEGVWLALLGGVIEEGCTYMPILLACASGARGRRGDSIACLFLPLRRKMVADQCSAIVPILRLQGRGGCD